MHEAGHAEIFGVDDFVSTRGIQNGLSMDAGLVMERRIAGNVIIKGNIDLNS